MIHPASISINNCPGEHHDFDFMGATLPRMTIEHGAAERPQSADILANTRRSSFGTLRVLIAPRSPWQNPYVERVIGSIRRECLDHVVVFHEKHLRRVLESYLRYYHASRTHLALEKDVPDSRSVEPPGRGKVVAFPEVGGLHHRYTRQAA